MKTLLLLVLAFSTSIFAQNADVYLGTYSLNSSNESEDGDAVINKSGGQYELLFNWYGADGRVGFSDEKISLKVSNGKLIGESSQECDDPGCCWLDQISAETSLKNGSKPVLEIYYSGYCYPDDGTDSDETEEIEGTIQFSKNYR